MHIKNILREEIQKVLKENRVITFNSQVYPNFGWCVILAGGGGSGKGYSLNRMIPISGKVIDVDYFKELYVKMNNNKIDDEEYDSLNPLHVKTVHQKVKQSRYKEKYFDNLFNDSTHTEIERLPNIIIDMTGKNPKKSVTQIAQVAKQKGYKVSLIWVIANRNEAILRNLMRTRRVPDSILHSIHNNLAIHMPEFLQTSQASHCLDEAWFLFNSPLSINLSKMSDSEIKDAAIQLKKTSNGFIITPKTQEKLLNYLGKQEEDPYNLQTYMASNDIINQYGKEEFDDDGNKIGYSFDRQQFNTKKDLYK